MYAWGQSCLEFVATGTAVRHLAGQGAHRAPDGRAFTSDLSAQDFFRLLAAGAVPVAFVLGTCVYHIAHQGVMQSLRQTGQNQEMLQFTQGVYEARELALARMQAEAAQAQSSGIVGVSVVVANHVWGEHATEFLATGTAIRRLAEEHKLPGYLSPATSTLGLDQQAHAEVAGRKSVMRWDHSIDSSRRYGVKFCDVFARRARRAAGRRLGAPRRRPPGRLCRRSRIRSMPSARTRSCAPSATTRW